MPNAYTSDKLTRAGLNLIQAALSIFDDELRLVLANQRFAQMFELPEPLVTPGAGFEEIIRFLVERGEYGEQTDADAAVRHRVETARAFQPHYMERQRANGRWISVEGAPLAEGGWITVYTDITEVKIQERLLRARSAELSEKLLDNTERLSAANRELAATNMALAEAQRDLTASEARTRLIMETTPAHIAHVDRTLTYTFSNRRMSSLMPGTPANVVGLPASTALGAATFAQIEPYMMRALSGEPALCEITHEESGRRIRVALTPDASDGGAYILSTDITEETQARAALMQTRKRALAAQLTSGLAHDFSNLLTVIMGLQNQILSAPSPSPDVSDAARATLAAARRGGELLKRIGGFSGDRALNLTATDLTALIQDIQAMAGPSLPPSVTLQIDPAMDLAPVLIDAGIVQDCLLNLILNARDSIGTQVGRITVSVRCVRDTWVQFTVTDTGPGFSAQALEHALDPFFTTKGGEGSGLGLAMVYDQITLSGGSIRLTNRPAGGAAVTLRLPLRFAPQRANGAPHLILLVEDNPHLRAHIRAMLQELGHGVLEAETGDEAATLANLPDVTLILSDIQLPGRIDGLDLLRQERARGNARAMGLMTALPLGDPRHQDAAREFPVLGKPVDAPALEAFVARLTLAPPLGHNAAGTI